MVTELTVRTTISDSKLPRLSITLNYREKKVVKMEHTLYLKDVKGAGSIPLTARHTLDAIAESVVHFYNAGVDISEQKFMTGLFDHINKVRAEFSVHTFESDLLKKKK